MKCYRRIIFIVLISTLLSMATMIRIRAVGDTEAERKKTKFEANAVNCFEEGDVNKPVKSELAEADKTACNLLKTPPTAGNAAQGQTQTATNQATTGQSKKF